MVLDVQALQSPHHGSRGIARYALEHADAILGAAPEIVERLLLNPRYTVPEAAERFLDTGRLGWSSRDLAVYDRSTIHHVMSPFESGLPLDELIPPAARRAGSRLAVTLYDLIPLVLADRYLADPQVRIWYHGRLQMVRAAHLVLAISEATARDAVDLLGIPSQRVKVVGAGVSSAFLPPSTPVEERFLRLREAVVTVRPGYLLYPGGIDPRKNMEGLISAYARLAPSIRARHQLVITCALRPGDHRQLMHLARLASVEEDLVLTGYVSDETLRLLYQCAHLVVFPSLYEGFGLPIAEAVACGAPVIGSDRSSIPEVIPSRDGLFDPDDEAAMAQLLERAATDASFRAGLVRASQSAAGTHTWQGTASATVDAYRSLAPVRPRAAGPRRLALVTPYPPDPTAIAGYSARLAEEFAKTHLVDVFVAHNAASHVAPCSERVRVLPVSGLARNVEIAGYEALIHCMGNNPVHEFVLDAVSRLGGTVLCHDARMVGYYAHGRRAAEFQHVLLDMYGERLGAGPLPQPHEAARHGLWMTREILEAADGVVAHSRFAVELLRMEAGLFGVDVPVAQVPFGFPEMLPAARDPRTCASPTIASFGLVDPIKRPELLIRALPAVRRRHPGAVLALVGPVDAVYASSLRRLAAVHAVGGAVTITGALTRAEYIRRMRATDVAVQLRASSQGESSLAVAETMSAGIPTVVTDMGWMAELPSGSVVPVGRDCSPGELAAAIVSVMPGAPARDAVAAAGRDHARASSFAVSARRLMEIALAVRTV